MNDKKKVTGVTSSKVKSVHSVDKASHVEQTEGVSSVGEVRATKEVGKVKGVGALTAQRRATRVMTKEERDHLFQMINEEADKMIESGAIPASQKDVVKSAVLMAVDASIVVEEDEKKK